MFSQPEKNIEQFHVDPGMIVVDLGAGSGFYALALSDAVDESGRVYAIEVQKNLVDTLKNQAESEERTNLKVIWGDIEEKYGSTLKDGVADRVVIANTLFQVENKEAVLKEASRLLRQRGRLLIVDWRDSFEGLGPHKEDVVTEGQAKSLCEKYGFVFEKEIEAGDHHYGLIFKAQK